MRSHRHRWFERRLNAVLGLLATATAIAALAAYHWSAELFAHFAPHYAAASASVLLVYVALRAPLRAAAAAALATYHIVAIWPPKQPAGEHAVVDEIKLVQFNVGLDHPNPAAVARWIVQQHADVVVLLEVGPRWAATLDTLRESFPYQTARLADSPFGIAMLARIPPTAFAVEPATEDPYPHIRLELRTPRARRPVSITGVHPPPPLSAEMALRRDERLATLARIASGEDETARIIAGDFNVTPWAPAYRRMLGAGWTDARARHPLQNTWPAWPGAALFGIAIDHTVVRGSVRIAERRVGPSLGSDHLPVVSRIEFLAPRIEVADAARRGP